MLSSATPRLLEENGALEPRIRIKVGQQKYNFGQTFDRETMFFFVFLFFVCVYPRCTPSLGFVL